MKNDKIFEKARFFLQKYEDIDLDDFESNGIMTEDDALEYFYDMLDEDDTAKSSYDNDTDTYDTIPFEEFKQTEDIWSAIGERLYALPFTDDFVVWVDGDNNGQLIQKNKNGKNK